MSVQLVQKWEDIDNAPVPASTVVLMGAFLKYNGTGGVIPATAGTALVGVSLLGIATTDPDYATAGKQLFYQKAGDIGQYRFIIPVGAGTAAASMIGSKFNLFDSVSIDVSGSGTQLTVTNVLSASLVEVTVILPA